MEISANDNHSHPEDSWWWAARRISLQQAPLQFQIEARVQRGHEKQMYWGQSRAAIQSLGLQQVHPHTSTAPLWCQNSWCKMQRYHKVASFVVRTHSALWRMSVPIIWLVTYLWTRIVTRSWTLISSVRISTLIKYKLSLWHRATEAFLLTDLTCTLFVRVRARVILLTSTLVR